MNRTAFTNANIQEESVGSEDLWLWQLFSSIANEERNLLTYDNQHYATEIKMTISHKWLYLQKKNAELKISIAGEL